jgi:DNA-binding MarR family transcriptional regulator
MKKIFAEKHALFESYLLTKKRGEIPVEINSHLFKVKGELTILSVARDITDRKKAEEEMKKRLMKFKLEEGNMYLIKERFPSMSIDVFKELLEVGLHGVVISRTPKNQFSKTFNGDFEYLWLAEKGENSISPDLAEIQEKIESLGRKNVILIDRLDYLVFKNSLEKTISFVQRLREITYLSSSIILFCTDASAFDKKHLGLFERETKEVNLLHETLSEAEFDILKIIFKHANMGIKLSYGNLSNLMGTSKPTARKRIRNLINLGYVFENLRGRNKFVELTDIGRSFFFK